MKPRRPSSRSRPPLTPRAFDGLPDEENAGSSGDESAPGPGGYFGAESQPQCLLDELSLGGIRTSVLVNTWNQAAYIEDCIDSLLVQTVLPDEIIVYDDGSTDGTVQRLRRYGSRIKLIEGKRSTCPHHVGQANAVYRAFLRSTGQLIFLLDGDDRFHREKIERYAAMFAANSDAALIQAPMRKIDQHGRALGTNTEPRKHVIDHLDTIYREQDVDLFYPTSALAFSRTFLDATLPLDFADGLPLWADTRLSVISPHFGRVITLAEPLTEWRRHVRSHSIRVRCRRNQLRQTWMRTRVFNQFCRTHGLPTISPWRNSRFYLQILRYALPDRAFGVFYDYLRPGIRSETAEYGAEG